MLCKKCNNDLEHSEDELKIQNKEYCPYCGEHIRSEIKKVILATEKYYRKGII